MKISYNVDKNGFYGDFGGAFIPEMMHTNIEELKSKYLKISSETSFKKEFDDLLEKYVGRPTPLYFAKRLSKKYNTKVYLKREDLCHTGAHKINNTIGQILLAKKLGKTRIIAETGAGQHGVATATVCALMGIKCIIYMGEVDISRQAPNVARMKMLGAEVKPAISGSKTLKDATNEAIRDWINNPGALSKRPTLDVNLTCESCKGMRFKEEVLRVKFNNKNIDNILKMTRFKKSNLFQT